MAAQASTISVTLTSELPEGTTWAREDGCFIGSEDIYRVPAFWSSGSIGLVAGFCLLVTRVRIVGSDGRATTLSVLYLRVRFYTCVRGLGGPHIS